MNEDPHCKKKSQTRNTSLHDILDTFLPRHLYDVCPPNPLPSPHPTVLSWERKLPWEGIKHLACNISQSTGGSRGRPSLAPVWSENIFRTAREEWAARICKVDASILINALPPFTGVPKCWCLHLDNRKTSKSREWRKCWLIEVWRGREPSQYCNLCQPDSSTSTSTKCISYFGRTRRKAIKLL